MTQYGPFHCEQNYSVGFMRSITSIGMVLGMISATIFVKNFGEYVISFSGKEVNIQLTGFIFPKNKI